MREFLDALEDALRTFGRREAFVSGPVTKTYREVADDLEAMERWLLASGCQPGDRIAALTFNCPETVLLEWATYRLGGTWIGIPTLERDLGNVRRLLADFAPKAVLVEPGAMGSFQPEALTSLPGFHCEETDLPSGVDSSRFRMLRRTGPGDPPDAFTLDGEAVVRIRYTSGATGEPKAIAYTGKTVGAILTNILEVIAPSEEETFVNALPNAWASGSLIAPVVCRGGKNVLLPRWNLREYVDAVTREPRSFTFLVPRLVADLADHSEHSGGGWAKGLGRALVAGSPTLIATMRRARARLPETRFLITFGQTEASFPVTLHEVEDRDVDRATNSRPFVPLGRLTEPYKDSEIDPETGELKLKGKAVAAGKWDSGSFLPFEQPLPTGDLVERDASGVLHYLGRLGTVADVRKGWPAREAVEALIQEYPGVKHTRVDAFEGRASRVFANVTVEPLAVDVEKATLLDFFARHRDEANLSAVSLGELRFGEVELTMSGKVKRNG